jgi:hypothetical protein
MKRLLTAFAMSLALIAALSGCKNNTKPATPATTPTTPTATTAPGGAAPAAPAQKAVPVDQYWEIQLLRLEATKKHYQAILAVYEKYKKDTPEARAEVQELQRKNRDSMQEIFKSRGFSSNDFYPRGEDRQKVLMERQQYLQGNAELKAKYQALAGEIRELRDKVKAYMPAPTPGAMGGGNLPPGHPPVPGMGMGGQPQPGQPIPGQPMPGMPAGHPPVAPGQTMPPTAPTPPPATAPTAPKAP